MSKAANLGDAFNFPGTHFTVNRMGYGAMQLAGPHVFGPPRDREAAIAVLREAIDTGIDHIDTSDFYGPHVTNQIIKEALHPYPNDLVIVSKLGAVRDDKGAWLPALSEEALTAGAHDNLRNLHIDAIDVVNLRVGGIAGPVDSSIEAPLTTLLKLKEQGLIKHIGLSNVTPGQLAEARKLTPIVCIQNLYNLANRSDDAFIDALNKQGIPYVPFFPLGGFTPLQSSELSEVATSLNASPLQVALAWLLHRSPNILLIPGTSSVEHLRENIAAAKLELSPELLTKLDTIGQPEGHDPYGQATTN